MYIDIKSDGTPTGTKVSNAKIGEPIGLVQKIEWSIEIGKLSKCTIHILKTPINLNKIESKVKKIKVRKGRK